MVATGCSDVRGTGDRGYLDGNGQIRLIPDGERGAPVELAQDDLDGAEVDLADLRGSVVVVNVWWSGCAPCVREAPLLVEAAKKVGDSAEFVGINIRDTSVASAQAFARRYELPFRTIFDPAGKAQLAFAADVNPRHIPSTLILDVQGRVAAVIAGPVPTALTLTGAIEEVAA
jgi:thiol-disulfide isomerase/thioredoxin